jgi:hypothetical protein
MENFILEVGAGLDWDLKGYGVFCARVFRQVAMLGDVGSISRND